MHKNVSFHFEESDRFSVEAITAVKKDGTRLNEFWTIDVNHEGILFFQDLDTLEALGEAITNFFLDHHFEAKVKAAEDVADIVDD